MLSLCLPCSPRDALLVLTLLWLGLTWRVCHQLPERFYLAAMEQQCLVLPSLHRSPQHAALQLSDTSVKSSQGSIGDSVMCSTLRLPGTESLDKHFSYSLHTPSDHPLPPLQVQELVQPYRPPAGGTILGGWRNFERNQVTGLRFEGYTRSSIFYSQCFLSTKK